MSSQQEEFKIEAYGSVSPPPDEDEKGKEADGEPVDLKGQEDAASEED